jgi:predicted ATPase/transcriptional regulator with XRE-family HTH domain
MTMDELVSYGEWLKQRRKTLDLTQAELAQRAGCSVFALRKIESGERRPSKQLARLLAQALELPPEMVDTFTRVARGELALDRLSSAATPRAGAPMVGPRAPEPHDNLPENLPPWLGREQELAVLSRLLQDPLCRLLTVIGAGGMGKTRLAIEASRRHRALFADGVCFVPLAPLTSSAFLVPAIAAALGLVMQGQSEPRAQLLDYLRGQQMLLVLDNIEHLLDGVGLLVEMLQRTPQVKLLVTSRERLNLQSEWIFVLQGLPVPPDGAIMHAQEYASVQLFVQSARRAKVDFELQDGDTPAVVSICRMVEGMPLGIELAAAWVPVLSCRAIAQEIERSLDFLATSVRDVPDRQRSLRAVFDHSWKLLAEEERGVLSRLAIFHGGFGRDAAAEIAGASLPHLYTLVSKSLLRHRENGRYDLHEVIRQYALAHLAQDPACTAAHDRHSQYYLSRLRERERDLKGVGQQAAIRELKEEIDNIRAAWAWAISREEFGRIGAALRSFGWLCNVGVLYREGIEQLEALVRVLRSRPTSAPTQAVLGAALAQAGMLYFRQGQFDQAMRLYDESLALLRPLEDPALLPDALVISGVILHLQGKYGEGQQRMEEALVCSQAAGDRTFAAYAYFNFGYIASLRGKFAEGYEQMRVGLAQWRELGDPSSIAMGLNFISPTCIWLGRLDEADAYLQESLALLTQVGDLWGMGTVYRLMGLSALARGDPNLALAHIRHSLDLFSGYITGWDIALSLSYLGQATAAAGDAVEAERILREAFAIAAETRACPVMLETLAALAQLHLQAGDAEQAMALSLAVMDHAATTYEVRERAGRVYNEASARLTASQQAAARAWAAQHPLETMLEPPRCSAV